MVGQAGKPKTITGFQTHTTPVLLAYGERAELATDECILFCWRMRERGSEGARERGEGGCWRERGSEGARGGGVLEGGSEGGKERGSKAGR